VRTRPDHLPRYRAPFEHFSTAADGIEKGVPGIRCKVHDVAILLGSSWLMEIIWELFMLRRSPRLRSRYLSLGTCDCSRLY